MVTTAAAPMLPVVTETHRLAAFELLCIHGHTYTSAMLDAQHAKLINACAAQIRTREFIRTTRRTVVPVKRIRLGSDGHPMGWCTQMAPGALAVTAQADWLDNSGVQK